MDVFDARCFFDGLTVPLKGLGVSLRTTCSTVVLTLPTSQHFICGDDRKCFECLNIFPKVRGGCAPDFQVCRALDEVSGGAKHEQYSVETFFGGVRM